MAAELNPQPNFKPADVYVVDDLETLKVLADPLRLRIRELMQEPTTVKQVATELDLPPTKLYYHINLLEKHGLIVLVDTQVVSGIIEKHYQVAARHMRVAKNLLSPSESGSPEGLTLTVNALFESTRDDLMKAAQWGAIELDDASADHKALSARNGVLHLTEEQAAHLYEDISALFKEYFDLSEQQRGTADSKPYHLLHMLFPMMHKRDRQESD